MTPEERAQKIVDEWGGLLVLSKLSVKIADKIRLAQQEAAHIGALAMQEACVNALRESANDETASEGYRLACSDYARILGTETFQDLNHWLAAHDARVRLEEAKRWLTDTDQSLRTDMLTELGKERLAELERAAGVQTEKGVKP